ncbi:interleukin-1 receptor type 1-like isoform X2 [Lampris incognitus]|uniref:interleukin-1 receptor type 1-like isoform X2 n=1 Tax=Lampris incognitus TaxID=2546036 RepID=UPI0024B5598F|nr:interleukin-1 receptor type 1-like isoform X2 [Lampris incognitus]
MGLRQSQWTVLSLLWLFGCSSEAEEKCITHRLKVEEVFSVPGDVAMLNSTLVSSHIFNFTSIPYNISWYKQQTGREMSSEAGRILVRAETLWFLKVELEDAGEYVCIVRTPSQCYRQVTMLVVDPLVLGDCGRPRKAQQTLSSRADDALSCPLMHYIKKLQSYSVIYSIKWYKGCTPIEDGHDKFTYQGINKLKFEGVEPKDSGLYTCTLTFTLGAVTGSISETINATVKEEYFLHPEVHEPTLEVIRAARGSYFNQSCRVFVPCVGSPLVDIIWIAGEEWIYDIPSDRVYAELQHKWRQDSPREGMWFEHVLKISELREEDFNVRYICRAYGDRGISERQFILLPEDPNILLPTGLVMGLVAILFINSVVLYYLFKIDIVLWFRRAFPVFYTNTAIVDSVEENMQASRRLLLLYTASTFAYNSRNSGSCNNNNNNSPNGSRKNNEHSICNNNNNDDDTTQSGIKTSDTSNCTNVNPSSSSETSNGQLHGYEKSNNSNDHKMPDSNGSDEDSSETLGCGSDGDTNEAMQRFLCDTAMHRALLEKSLKVVLVEMEEVTPEQLALFPESVHHLRRKQGAVCWWRNQGTRKGCSTCVGRDEEKGGQESSSLSPSSRFWKQIRYYMPIRGKRVSYPEKTALLNL